MRILITGNKGFVGTVTEKYFKEKGLEVVGYDIMDGFDIRDPKQFEQFVVETKPDRILHLAAVARFDEADNDPKRAFETNVLGTFNVSKIAETHKIPIVYASTGSVYMPISEEPPITEDFKAKGNSVYGCCKYMGEIYLRSINAPWIVMRYAHLYGKEKRHHGLIGGFIKRIEHDMEPVLYGGKQSNDFCYIDDIAVANYRAVTASFDVYNQIYNIGTGEELSAEDAGRAVCDIMGYKGKIEIREGRTVDPLRFVYDTSKAERMLGFKAAFNFKAGLTAMLKE